MNTAPMTALNPIRWPHHLLQHTGTGYGVTFTNISARLTGHADWSPLDYSLRGRLVTVKSTTYLLRDTVPPCKRAPAEIITPPRIVRDINRLQQHVKNHPNNTSHVAVLYADEHGNVLLASDLRDTPPTTSISELATLLSLLVTLPHERMHISVNKCPRLRPAPFSEHAHSEGARATNKNKPRTTTPANPPKHGLAAQRGC